MKTTHSRKYNNFLYEEGSRVSKSGLNISKHPSSSKTNSAINNNFDPKRTKYRQDIGWLLNLHPTQDTEIHSTVKTQRQVSKENRQKISHNSVSPSYAKKTIEKSVNYISPKEFFSKLSRTSFKKPVKAEKFEESEPRNTSQSKQGSNYTFYTPQKQSDWQSPNLDMQETLKKNPKDSNPGSEQRPDTDRELPLFEIEIQ